MKRTALPRSTTPLQRKTRLRPVSTKRRKEAPLRKAVREQTLERAGYQCEARLLVPEVSCGGFALQVDERVGRGVRPGAHLEVELTQALCPRHHQWKTEHPAEARNRGLRLCSWEAA